MKLFVLKPRPSNLGTEDARALCYAREVCPQRAGSCETEILGETTEVRAAREAQVKSVSMRKSISTSGRFFFFIFSLAKLSRCRCGFRESLCANAVNANGNSNAGRTMQISTSGRPSSSLAIESAGHLRALGRRYPPRPRRFSCELSSDDLARSSDSCAAVCTARNTNGRGNRVSPRRPTRSPRKALAGAGKITEVRKISRRFGRPRNSVRDSVRQRNSCRTRRTGPFNRRFRELIAPVK